MSLEIECDLCRIKIDELEAETEYLPEKDSEGQQCYLNVCSDCYNSQDSEDAREIESRMFNIYARSENEYPR